MSGGAQLGRDTVLLYLGLLELLDMFLFVAPWLLNIANASHDCSHCWLIWGKGWERWKQVEA